jgi:uncharacterized membrane protein YdbT with pleckstrin-like domain
MSHSYLKKKVVGVNESIKVVAKINPIFVVLRWIWGVLGCWLLLIPTIKAIRATVIHCTTEYLVTDKSVMRKDGLFRTHTNQMPLNKIKNMDVKYTFWGKVFNYATITFSAGSNNVDIVFNCVKNAEKIKKMVNTLM